MKSFLMSAGTVLLLAVPLHLVAQSATASSPVTRKAVPHTAQPRTTPSGTAAAASQPGAIKLPASIPVVKGAVRTEYALRYTDFVVGTGALATPGLIYSVHYTGWLYNGTKFDSSLDRGTPIQFQQGQHRVILGWDSGFEGMRVGGKRRLFIPYELAYGDTVKGPIPAKSNLIFDVELVKVEDPATSLPGSTPRQ